MFSFDLIGKDNQPITGYTSDKFTRQIARHPLLAKTILERMEGSGIYVDEHRTSLVKSMCQMLALGATFTDCTVGVDSDGPEVIKFSIDYPVEGK